MNKCTNNLGPFKLWTIENFPFIEEDFDAITNYQLYSKIVEYLKKIAENQKYLSEENKAVFEYFENLDVQEEIDNKLDEMAESGELTDIIAQYLQLAGVLVFDTLDDLENATNIVDGSSCYILGESTYNDGKGAYYKIRTITSDDTVDGLNIVALDISDTLIAERIPNYYINDLTSRVSNLELNENKYYQTRHQVGTVEVSDGVYEPLYSKIINTATANADVTNWTHLVEVDTDVDVIYEIKGVMFNDVHDTAPVPRYESDEKNIIFHQNGDYIDYKCIGYTEKYLRILVLYTLQ